MIIEKYLKNEVTDSNNIPYYLRFLSVFHNLNKSKTVLDKLYQRAIQYS